MTLEEYKKKYESLRELADGVYARVEGAHIVLEMGENRIYLSELAICELTQYDEDAASDYPLENN